MSAKVNTYQSSSINVTDHIVYNHSELKVTLEEKNSIKDRVVLLYIYSLPKMPMHGYKVGMTICKTGETYWHSIKSRIDTQVKEVALGGDLFDDRYEKYGLDREVHFWGVCINDKDDNFKDHDIHREIATKLPGYSEKNQEWFTGDITLDDLIDIFEDYRKADYSGKKVIYTPRKEQKAAIDKLLKYFKTTPSVPRFLLNCKMRFGKCYTTYKYAEEAELNKILILTFVPAVEDSWREDLKHIEKDYDYFTDFELAKSDFKLNNSPSKPYVLFLSLQNYLGRDSSTQQTKDKIKKLQGIEFDLLVLDEYHFGAWNDRTQETIEDMDKEYQKNLKNEANSDIAKKFGITTKETICLSGTPFKAIDRGEFSDANTYPYSYFDEQKNKYPNEDFSAPSKEYAHFPDMKIFGYNMSNIYSGLTDQLMSKEKILNNKAYFSLNKFFETKKDLDPNEDNEFIYEEQIVEWFSILQGSLPKPDSIFPYQNPHFSYNKHTLWLMPSVNSCQAMTDLLKKDPYFNQYEIVNLSSKDVGSGYSALKFLERRILASKQKNKLGTISLTVNKLTLGVTVKPWTSIFVLKDLSSPEQYFQAIFRAQTPDVDADGNILKKQSNVYDFNIDRASALLLHYTEKSGNVTKLELPKLIVKYLPIYMNGNVDSPISEEIFYELAQFGYSNKSLSQKIKDIERTTRALDEKTIADMMNDPQCSDVIKRVFAHAKFDKPKTKTAPSDSRSDSKSIESLKGRKIGYENGLLDYKLYIEIEDEAIQELFLANVKKLVSENCPTEYHDDQRKRFFNGLITGYESGVNVPIKNMKCGLDDGKKFVDEVKKKFGKEILYTKETRIKINNFIHDHLNNKDNIPVEFQGKMMIRWYRESFRSIIVQSLKPLIKDTERSVEDTHNVLKHILSKVFQFLYISVYRETTFKEVFVNADSYVFHSAVGIKKEEFEILNKYNIFQERILDNYIHEFFVNESLGKQLDTDSELFRKNYRNSFNWFGFGIEN
ncbi:MAG: DEAD/DEAH box helicase family protein [Candidatus Delongbacteria bacterium]|nr:DEAD/DEAH box helicase family protein [Candidatus Delongbacteria bacterium]